MIKGHRLGASVVEQSEVLFLADWFGVLVAFERIVSMEESIVL